MQSFVLHAIAGFCSIVASVFIIQRQTLHQPNAGEKNSGSNCPPSLLVEKDFDRARETAWLVGPAYDFKNVGLPGVNLAGTYAYGYDACNSTTGQRLPNEGKFDVTWDHRIQTGTFRGLWFRLRNAYVDFNRSGKNYHFLCSTKRRVTREFSARPASVSDGALFLLFPLPTTLSRPAATPCSTR